MPTHLPDRPERPASARRATRHLGAVALLVVLSAGPYAATLDYALQGDDLVIVREARHIRSLSNVGLFFRPAYWREHRPGKSYRPVVEASMALNWAVSGGRPAGLRAVNVALATAVAALLYGLVWRLARSVSGALIAGLVYALHPMRLETITLVKNRSEILAGLFGLLALLWYLRAAAGGRGWWVWWLGSAAATAAALGSKEVALVLPLVLTAAALTVVPRHSRRRALAMTAPIWLMAVGLVILLFTSLPGRYPQWETTDFPGLLEFGALGPAERGLVTVKTVGTYLGLLAWPFTICHHRAFEIPRHLWRADVLASLGAMLVVAALVVWTWRWAAKGRRAAFALIWLALAIGPVANLFPVATRPIAEQRLFGATMPFAILVGLVLARLGALWFVDPRPDARPPGEKGSDPFFVRILATVLLVGWLGAMGAATAAALPAWRTELALWERTARQAPGVWRAQYNCGTERVKHGQFEEAAAAFQRAARLNDLQARSVYNLAYALLGMGRHQEAIPLLRLALTWEPDQPAMHATFGVALLGNRQVEAAVREAQVAVRLAPEKAGHHATLGRILVQAGRIDEAIPSLRRARDLAQDDLQHRLVLVDALERAGRLEEALAECQAIIQRWPGQPPAQAAQARARRILMQMSGR